MDHANEPGRPDQIILPGIATGLAENEGRTHLFNRKMKIMFTKYISFFLLPMLLVACSSADKKVEKEVSPASVKNEVILTAEQIRKGQIITGELISQKINTTVTVNGVVDVPPQNMVSVSFPLGGYLKYTKLLPGMHVSRGEIIAQMEDQSLVQLQQDYLVTKAKLEYLEKEYNRQKELNADKVNSDKTLQQVTADYTSQKIMLKGYAEKLRLISISPERLTEEKISRQVALYSPINGYVSKVNVNTGKFVQPTDVLFELINPDDIHAALSIFEKDLGKVSIGQKVKISFVDEPEKEYIGEVILVNRNVDENRTAIAHCHFLSHPKQLLPGMFLNALIQVKEAMVNVLPEGSIVRFENKEYVFIESGSGSFRMIEITTGEKDRGMVEIKSGLESLSGKKIVTGNAYSVLGALVNTGEE
jgi:cobalt-zinc-cadmium efflux system membrane fusion protein